MLATLQVLLTATLCVTFAAVASKPALTKSDLQQLAQSIVGEIEFPDEHDQCLLSDKMVFTAFTCPRVNSLAIIIPESTGDVSTAIAFLSQFATPFRIKSGGNSLGGYSKCEQCVNINLEKLKGLQYYSGSQLNNLFADANLIEGDVYLMVETGVTMREVVTSFTSNSESYRRRIPHSDAPLVAAGGYYQSGGWAETIRTDGYASDYIIGAEVVLADGTIVTTFDELQTGADSNSSSADSSSSDDDSGCHYKKDLLWALRGSGGGSFGVVTKFYMKTLALPSADEIMTFRVRYRFMDMESGKAVMRACANFTILTSSQYITGCGISAASPSPSVPYGYFFLVEGKYFGTDIGGANGTVHDILLNDQLLSSLVIDAEFRYPPIEYDLATFVGAGSGARPGISNTRMIESFDMLTDDFYEAFIGFFVNTIGLVDGTRCVCGFPGSTCSQCKPGVNDLLTCCGAGARSLFYLYGDDVHDKDPNNCWTSAPNRNSVGRTTFIAGTVSPAIYDALEESVVYPLIEQGIADVFVPHLGDQNYVGYRDVVDTTLDSYFGAGNEAILQELQRIKCKYDPDDVFHHPLTIAATDCAQYGSSSDDEQASPAMIGDDSMSPDVGVQMNDQNPVQQLDMLVVCSLIMGSCLW